MDSHETDTNLTNQLDEPPEQLDADNGSNATLPNVKLSSSANTNNSKENDNIQSNRDHNVPDSNTQQYIRSTIMIGDEIASTSNQNSSSRRKPSLSNQKKSGSSSSSSPIMSPSYNQNNKQYRTNIPRAVDLVENLKHSYDNKENVPGIQTHQGSQSEYRLDSPKYALQQNSPNTPLSSYKSPPSTHSSPMYTAHEIRTDCPMFTYSPLITEPYKHSTYFHFPDVDTPSSIDGKPAQQTTPKPTGFNNNVVSISDSDTKFNESTHVNNNNNNNNNNADVAKAKCSSMNSPQIIAPEESHRGCIDGTNKKREASVRRARLKSISLDSDGARLVEENLCIPVEELVERKLPQKTQFDYDDTTSFYTPTNFDISTNKHQQQSPSNNMRSLSKKINHLVLDLSIKDDSLRHIEYQTSPLAADEISTATTTTATSADTIDGHSKYSQNDTNSNRSKSATTPKTPTLTNSRQKAISLDSAPKCNEYDHRSQSVQSTSTDSVGGTINIHGKSIGIAMRNAGNTTVSRNKPHLMSNFLCVESNSSMSVPTTPKRQQLVKKTLSKFNANPGKLVGRKPTFAANAEYYLNKKTGQERKYNEKMHISSDTEPIFEGDPYDDVYMLEMDTTSSFETESCDDVDCEVISGPELGLRRNIGMNALSLSNYSLSNFQGSHCSLTRSNHNIFGMTNTGGHQLGPKSSKSTNMISSPSSSSNVCKTVVNPITVQHQQQKHQQQQQQQQSYHNQTTRTNFCAKKNLLQRRGSNTSLTLNIVGGAHTMNNTTNHSTLNRFNSHNALNDMQRTTNPIQTGKKLLERRNSNASLTIHVECRSNVPKRALSTSMCYLRGSDLCLNSSSVNSFESPEHQVCTLCGGVGILKSKHLKRQSNTESNERTDKIASAYEDLMESSHENQSKYTEYEENIDTNHSNVARDSQRKFFSSENLNVQNTFSICQLPIKTSSVVDLNQANSEVEYCPCSINITRNITTKPLSPQTTSEDFKIYLANIQMLQNASHLLTESKLSALGNTFNRSYASTINQRYDVTDSGIDSNKACRSCETCTICKTCKLCETKCRCVQNCLLRSVHQEFWDLPTNYQEKPLVSGSHAKNRYKTILPNEHSRVILEPEYKLPVTFAHNQEQSTAEYYINANYIKGPDYTQYAYIATQGPMMNTIYDFWLMVYQNYRKNLKSIGNHVDIQPYQQKIAMLTDIIENDVSKCAIYFSPNINKTMCFLSNRERNRKNHRQSQMRLDTYFNNYPSKLFDRIKPNEIYTKHLSDDDCVLPEFEFNFFAIQTVDCVNKGGYSMRKFHCLYYTCEKSSNGDTDEDGDGDITPTMPNSFERKVHLFAVYHYWFPHWPDHRSPENIDAVLDMCINLIDADCDEDIKMGGNSTSRDNAQNTTKSNKLNEIPLVLNELSKPNPIPIIHCSAGIGRTGCVIGILNGLRQLKQSYLSTPLDCASNGKNALVDILGIVSNLRLQRGGMVQNSEQYELIHRALCLYHQRHFSKRNNKE